MENRKLLKFLAPIVLLGAFVFSVENALAYDPETHAFLVKETVDFYNLHFPKKKLSPELTPYLMDGARLEDNVPRYFNHFYDPVNNRGLADWIYKGMASKLWAEDEKEQLAMIYRILPQTVPSLLTAAQIQKIQPEFSQSNFTWQKAIELYAKGKTEEAMFALGHTFHLIEDAAVPEHTRNDAHPPFDEGGSPYENWTERFNLDNPDPNLKNRLLGKKPIISGALGDYFDGIANYSNNNFYSKDSIKNYELPKPDYFGVVGDYTYGFKNGDDGIDYYLAAYIVPKDFDYVHNLDKAEALLQEKNGHLIVLPGYWDRLSTKAVQYGAGVLDLFFKEAEAAKQKYLTEKAQRPFLATLVDGLKNIFGGGEVKDIADTVNEFKLVSEVPIADKNQEVKNKVVQPVKPLEDQPRQEPNIETEIVALDLRSAEPIKPVDTKICSYLTDQSPTRQGVVLNEIAWMGTAASVSNEWIELQNRSSAEIDISGWQLVDMQEQIRVELSGRLASGGFYLLERTDDNSVPGIAADQIYKGDLRNAGEGLRLFDKDCNLIDEAMAAPDWPAGDNNFKYTMERSPTLSWRNYGGSGQNGIYGTPKAENSPGAAPINYSGGGSSPVPASNPVPIAPNESPKPVDRLYVFVSEVQAGTEANGAEDEFVELYNAGDQSVNLTGWSLKKKTSTGTESNLLSSGAFSGTIAPKSFFLIAHANYRGNKTADLTYSANSNNLAYTNNTVVLYDGSGTVIDEVAYTNIPKDQSLERKALENGICVSASGSGELLGNGCDTNAANDFEIRNAPNPQNTQSPQEPPVGGVSSEASEPEPEPAPEPTPTPAGISNIVFSKDAGGNYISFTLNDTIQEDIANGIHYILVWLNSDPKEMTSANRSSGINPNWAGYCPSTGIVAGNGGDEGVGGTGFDNYVMPGYEPANKPPVYDPAQSAYDYKVYFTDACPSTGFSDGRDLKGELTSADFVTMGLWLYHGNMGFINEAKSINYPTHIYFQP